MQHLLWHGVLGFAVLSDPILSSSFYNKQIVLCTNMYMHCIVIHLK